MCQLAVEHTSLSKDKLNALLQTQLKKPELARICQWRPSWQWLRLGCRGGICWGDYQSPIIVRCKAVAQRPSSVLGWQSSIFSSRWNAIANAGNQSVKNDSLQDQSKPSAKYYSVLFFKLNSPIMCLICGQISCASECLVLSADNTAAAVQNWCQNQIWLNSWWLMAIFLYSDIWQSSYVVISL